MLEDIVFSEKEKEFYYYLFTNFKKPTSEYIEGGEVAQLFMKADLRKVYIFLT